MNPSYLSIKRLIDVCLSLVLFLALSPLFLLIYLLLAVIHKGNPLFRQKRPGLQGKLFTILKFKTMSDARDAAGQLLPDTARLTPIGRVIRASSLDELPQLLNVLKGDMSMVGPRPLLEEYLPLYNEEERRRHDVRPGVTGWAQVNGRNAISWRDKFCYDVWYVDNMGFRLDCRILFLTLIKVVRPEGIGSDSSDTVQKFSKSL